MAASIEEITAQVQGSLEATPYACMRLEKLSGGSTNFVFRGNLTVPLVGDGSTTVVIKYTPPYVASNPAFKLTETRCKFEESILTALHGFPATKHSDVTVKTPSLHYFSSSTNTQIYSDLASSADLKTFALNHPISKEDSYRIGKALGVWAKGFHSWAQTTEQKPLRDTMSGNTDMKYLKFTINYDILIATIDKFPSILARSRSTFETVREDVRNSSAEELIHGDFWTGNVLLPNRPLSDKPLTLYVIDWMFAELFELKHFKNVDAGVWLICAFMEGYGPLNDDLLAFKTAIHVGTHLICWGSRVAGWGTQKQVEEVVEIGRDFVIKGWEKDRTFFQTTPLSTLFR